jgi:hypothetical protein
MQEDKQAARRVVAFHPPTNRSGVARVCVYSVQPAAVLCGCIVATRVGSQGRVNE